MRQAGDVPLAGGVVRALHHPDAGAAQTAQGQIRRVRRCLQGTYLIAMLIKTIQVVR